MPSRKGAKAGTSHKSHKRKSTRKKGKRSSHGRGDKAGKRSSRAIGAKAGKRSCQTKLKNKIRINMAEYKKGRFSSRKQALAVSYAQVKKKSPSCKKYFKR